MTLCIGSLPRGPLIRSMQLPGTSMVLCVLGAALGSSLFPLSSAIVPDTRRLSLPVLLGRLGRPLVSAPLLGLGLAGRLRRSTLTLRRGNCKGADKVKLIT